MPDSKHIPGFWSKTLNKHEIFDKPATYTPVMGKTSVPPPSEPPMTINLVRAVFDEAGNIVTRIDRELAHLESRKEQLLLEREAHADLLEVATRHMKKMGGK